MSSATTPAQQEHFHATSVAVGGVGALIVGGSGSGKSALALGLIALGADLISDDLTRVTLEEGRLIAHAPAEPLTGVIEARGVGLVRVPHVPRAVLRLVIDMDQAEEKRLPERHVRGILGHHLDLVFRVDAPYFACAVFNLLRAGRYA